MATGIFLGLMAAFLQSVNYICNATFSARHPVGALTQFLLVHLTVGALSLLILPFVWDDQALSPGNYALPLVGAVLTLIAGQTALYRAIRLCVASRVSPLLGIKVMVLALIGVFWLHEQYQIQQWLGVFLCVAGAIWLSLSGGIISGPALFWVVMTCVSYALADLCVVALISCFEGLPTLQAAGLSVALCYLLVGVICLAWWPRLNDVELLKASIPSAVSWFMAVTCLFGCFAFVGVVFGGILQSSRGVISILLGLGLTWWGFRFAEPLPQRRVFIQRFSAASLMLVAITMFTLGATQ